jgi:acetyl esterase/lipase
MERRKRVFLLSINPSKRMQNMTKFELNKLKKTVPQEMVYKVVDGRQLRLFVFEPQENPTACILCIHGGGWKRETPQRLFPHAAFFAENGTTAACVEYRFINESIDVRTCLEDCVDALVCLRERYKDIPIVALGDSAGAYLANCLGCEEILGQVKIRQKTVDFVVDLNGIVDLTGKWSYAISEENPQKKEELEKQYSPLYRLSPKDAPTLIVHGEKDTVVDIADARKYANALTKKGVENELWLLPNAQHAFILFDYVHENDFVARVLERITLFLKEKAYIR